MLAYSIQLTCSRLSRTSSYESLTLLHIGIGRGQSEAAKDERGKVEELHDVGDEKY